MAKIWQPKDIKLLRSWYDAVLEEASDSLTDWETNFMESIGNRLNYDQALSQRQEEILETIYAKYTN